MHNNQKFIEELTFQQIKAITQANTEQLHSFEKQFSGCIEVIA